MKNREKFMKLYKIFLYIKISVICYKINKNFFIINTTI